MSWYNLFAQAIPRLAKTKWGTRIMQPDGSSKDTAVQELAEELMGIFGSQGPIQVAGPIQLYNPTGGPVFELNSGNGPTIVNKKPDGTTAPIGTTPTPPEGGGSSGSGIAGKSFAGFVVGGAGASYLVELIDGPVVEVTQLQIDENETIPAGTGVIVTAVTGGGYYMQVPVWLPDDSGGE